MTVTIIKKVGEQRKTDNILVRYSSELKGLFTTTKVLSDKGIAVKDILFASAPFKIVEGEWNDSGWEESPEFFENVCALVIFADANWNYM